MLMRQEQGGQGAGEEGQVRHRRRRQADAEEGPRHLDRHPLPALHRLGPRHLGLVQSTAEGRRRLLLGAVQRRRLPGRQQDPGGDVPAHHHAGNDHGEIPGQPQEPGL